MFFFIGPDCTSRFIQNLSEDIQHLYDDYYRNVVPMKDLTVEETRRHQNEDSCIFCGDKFQPFEYRVRDHCHLTSEYRGPAHNSCNLRSRIPNFIPILMHNLSGYDSHLFFSSLKEIEGDIKVIALNKEKYISISKKILVDNRFNTYFEMRFLDSYRFLNESIDSLSKNLGVDDFKLTTSHFRCVQDFDLIKRKGVFPYNYLNSWDRLEDDSLPSKSAFFNNLTNEECSDESYEVAQKIWNHFKCKNMNEYMQIYLQSDVVLLADIFENFRHICQKIYQLDPCHYYTTPGLSWDAMLKATKIELQLLTDLEMYKFFQKGVRGGLTQCCHRYSKVNNKFIKSFNPDIPSSYLMYFDVNNLYGWAMKQFLPYGGFQWVSSIEQFTEKFIMNYNNKDIGYVLEVDIEYPSNLHDFHNDLPFCPENICTPGTRSKKLVTSFYSKTNYVIHIENLRQILKHGLRVKKIHRVIQFNHSKWLQKYIDLNTHHRKQATSVFEKNFFKLMNNSIYGKTMENVEKRTDVKIVTHWENIGKRQGARALLAKPNVHSTSTFSENMIAIQLKRVKIVYNKPLYLGFVVLELSKLLMYDFHYEYMKKKFNENVLLNYMDTDSFIYTIKTNDFYSDIYYDLNKYFDTSDYGASNVHNFPSVNIKKIGMFKDENGGKKMLEFIGLRAKMYSFIIDDGTSIQKAKGVKKSVTKRFTIEHYKKCLFDQVSIYRNMLNFKSKLHTIYTQNLNKKALSFEDTKRYICNDKISTLAWGHYKIEN